MCIKSLLIQNIVLIEQSRIGFEAGFNVLSGETGSGKSAVMDALQLALGGRADLALIRQGAEKGGVEAVFDISRLPQCQNFLDEKGIEVEDPSLLILRRELHSSGKSRAWVNHQPVQLTVLRQLGDLLVEMVGQHANHKLFHLDEHRKIVDLFGGLQEVQKHYVSLWQEWEVLSSQLKELEEGLPASLRTLETCRREIEEIEGGEWMEGEEEELFQEYNRLSSAEELKSLALRLEASLAQEEGVLSILSRSKQLVAALIQKDSSLKEDLSIYSQVVLEVEELVNILGRYQARLTSNPERLHIINERLSRVHRLKKKYGPSLEDVEQHLQKQKKALASLSHREEEIEEKRVQLGAVEERLIESAHQLTQARERSAQSLSKALSEQLGELNMKNMLLDIQVHSQSLGPSGADRIEFFLRSAGIDRLIALRDGASGGELARILLALHILLAGKEGIGTLVFDEIDANIGGTTATLIGKKLNMLGKSLQVLCITHFPQVAQSAQHHLRVCKVERAGRSFSEVVALSAEMREEEVARMLGRKVDEILPIH